MAYFKIYLLRFEISHVENFRIKKLHKNFINNMDTDIIKEQ